MSITRNQGYERTEWGNSTVEVLLHRTSFYRPKWPHAKWTQFSDSVFHTLSCGVVHCVPTASFIKLINRSLTLAVNEFWPFRKRFLELLLGTKLTTPQAGHEKLCQKIESLTFALFCLWSLVPLERCDCRHREHTNRQGQSQLAHLQLSKPILVV